MAAVNDLPVKQFPADWKTHGKAAGPIRNKQMAEYADAAIIFVVNFSAGSMNMMSQMIKLKKPVVVIYFDEKQTLIGHTVLFTSN